MPHDLTVISDAQLRRLLIHSLRLQCINSGWLVAKKNRLKKVHFLVRKEPVVRIAALNEYIS